MAARSEPSLREVSSGSNRKQRWLGVALLSAAVAVLFGHPYLIEAIGLRSYHGLRIDRPAYNFQLRDVQGDITTLRSFRGQPLLVFFGYSNCTGICYPALHELNAVALDADIQNVLRKSRQQVSSQPQPQLQSAQYVRETELLVLFISIDPARDGVPELKRLEELYGSHFIALRSGAETTRSVAARYLTMYEYNESAVADGRMDQFAHPGTALFIDANGQLQFIFTEIDSAMIKSDLSFFFAKFTDVREE